MKHTIRAFALGLATATALLTFTYYQTIGQTESKAITDQKAIQHLEDQDYHVLSQTAFENLRQKETEEPPTQDSSTKEKEQNQKDEESKQKTKPKSFSLTINPGMPTSSISDKLEQADIIKDQAAFEVFLKDQDFSRSIQIGTYKLNSDMTIETIAKKITGKLD